MTYVELPAFHMLSSLLARNDDDKLRDLAPIHPLLQLAHDLLDVGLDLVIGSHWGGQGTANGGANRLPTHHSQAIFLHAAYRQR
jgi:hypothetical protein